MEDFATTQDLESFWRTFKDNAEETRASSLLQLASAYLRQAGKNNNIDIDAKITAEKVADELVDDDDGTGSVYKDSVRLVILAAVKRAMLTPQDAPPADQWSQSASPYSESMTFTNPSNDLYFKQAELQLIGLSSVAGNSKIGLIRGVRGAAEPANWGDIV